MGTNNLIFDKLFKNCKGRFLEHDIRTKKILYCGPVKETIVTDQVLQVDFEWVASPVEYYTRATWRKQQGINLEIELEKITFFRQKDREIIIFVFESDYLGTTTKIYPLGYTKISPGQIVFN